VCIAVPCRIIEIDEYLATVEIGGIQKKVRLDLLSDAAIGDYVIVHAGFAIQKLDAEEAEETLRLLREMADEISR
jgi:hydrogenase expression/formation protein HypC